MIVSTEIEINQRSAFLLTVALTILPSNLNFSVRLTLPMIGSLT